MKKIKVLNKDMTSPYKKFIYELGRKYTAQHFDEDKTVDCSNGLYATDVEGLPYAWNVHRRAFECEVGGRQVIYDQFKQRFEHLTLIRELRPDELKEMALKKEKDVGYKLSEVLFPVNPLSDKPKKVALKEIKLLQQWASVGDPVVASVWDSVWDSVRAYISSLFPNIIDWKYIKHEKGENPFKSGIDLWRSGFVPSFNGRVWRLHSGEDAKIVYEIEKEDL
jgi:hypothetical protein